MKDRIRALRKTFGLTQSEFGDKIGVKGNTITNYENGNRSISDAVILSICREYGCDETWLRTGEGEMHLPVNRDQAITDFMADILKGSPDFRTKLVGVLTRLSVEEWDMLEHRARELADALNQDDEPPV